jgi:hypothetical protein
MPGIAFLTRRVRNTTEAILKEATFIVAFSNSAKEEKIRLLMNQTCMIARYLDSKYCST